MPSRTFIRIACALFIAACGFALAEARPDTRARAEVFTRNLSGRAEVIFAWDAREKVSFSAQRQGNEIVLHFAKPVALRWGSSLEAVDSYIKGARTRGDGSTVILSLNRPARPRYLYSVGRDNVNVDENGLDLVPAPPEKMPIATLDEVPEGPEPHIAGIVHRERAKPAKKPQVAEAKHHPPQAEAKLTPPPEAKVKAAPPPLPQTTALASLAPAAGTPAPAITIPAEVPGPPPLGAPSPATIAAPVVPVTGTPAAPLIVQAQAANGLIPLPFKDGEPFAVFSLHGAIWVAGEHFTPPPADSIKTAGAPYVVSVKTVPDPHATILAITTSGDVSASVEKASSEGVRLHISPGEARLSQTFVPALVTAAGKSSITIPAGKTTKVWNLQDPATGNTISVIPSSETGAGLAPGRSFVEFNLLPSAQGVAVEHLADGTAVNLAKGIVEISSASGLAISPEMAEQLKEAESNLAFAHLAPTLFPYARWKLDDEKNYVAAQEKLFQDIAFSTGDAADEARLKLLGLYLGEGLFPEALGMSDDILRSSLKFYLAHDVSALRGAANLFMYRFREAQRDFSVPELKGNPEADMLRALTNELLGQSSEKFDFSANYDRYISHYPPSFIQKLAIIAADRDIAAKDYDDANTIFETLKRDNYDEPVKKYVDYMRAKILSETHGESEAAKIWEDQAKDLEDPLIRARAEFSLINMLLKSDKISHDEAIKRLERLRIVWRGDSLELSVLTLLGNLYLQEKRYADALHTMREIVLYYPEVPEAITTARQMEATFVTLYNKDGANSMPPLEAMGLFYEFRDLVPLGPAGDLMIRNLADRLVNIDLLNRAAMLLDHQIKNRLQGEERSRVGAHLANIYLMNHEPDKALETLKTTGYGNLPPDVELQRLRLTARALAQQGKTARAVEVIASDTSPEGSLLRLSIYWDNKDWTNVVSTAEDILGNRTDPGAPLNPGESKVLLKLATAYVYEHDTGQLQYLRDYFTPLMKDNPNRDSFLFITGESDAVDYNNLGLLDQDIRDVKSFLDKNRDKQGKNGMSQAAN